MINLYLQISPQIFVKIFEIALMKYSGARGNWFMKNIEAVNLLPDSI